MRGCNYKAVLIFTFKARSLLDRLSLISEIPVASVTWDSTWMLTPWSDTISSQYTTIYWTIRKPWWHSTLCAGFSWRSTISFHNPCNTRRTGTDYTPWNSRTHLDMGAQFTTVYVLLATALLEQVLLSHILHPPGWNQAKGNLYVLGRTSSAEDNGTGNCWCTGGIAFALLESCLLVGLQYNILTR